MPRKSVVLVLGDAARALPVIRASGEVRKVRWQAGGKGKSGGVRVIYYWATADEQIFLLTLYGKGEKEDLSAADLKRVVRLAGGDYKWLSEISGRKSFGGWKKSKPGSAAS